MKRLFDRSRSHDLQAARPAPDAPSNQKEWFIQELQDYAREIKNELERVEELKDFVSSTPLPEDVITLMHAQLNSIRYDHHR